MEAKPGRAPPDSPPDVVALLKAVRQRLAGAEERWTLERWHEEMAHLRAFSVKHDLGLHGDDPAVIDLKDGSVGVARWPTVVRVDPAPPFKVGDTVEGPLLVYPDRPDRLPREPEALRHVGFLLPWSETPALIVSLRGTDEHIRTEVEKALRARAARERHSRPALPRTTTAAAFTRSLNDPGRHAFKRWRTYKISELAELLAWRARLPEVERDECPDNWLGYWIDGEDFTPQKTSEALKVLRDAIECMPEMLAEQLEGGAASPS